MPEEPVSENYDIVIVGGGMVGASLALALSDLPYRVAVVEAWPPSADGQPSYDDRATALAEGSRRIFATLGCWSALARDAAPINKVHVSDRGRFGFTRLRAEDYGVDALGHVVENRVLGRVLWEALAKRPRTELLAPWRVTAVAAEGDAARVELAPAADGNDADGDHADGPRELSAALVVAADGARSRTREMLGMAVRVRDYDQHAVIANVTPSDGGAGDEAYERFTDTGPLALLPMTGGRWSLVWTVTPARAAELVAADEPTFLGELQTVFGYRLGRFERAGRRQSYPLKLVRALDQQLGRVLLIGNAAHGLHPVAGQGFNLGLRDVAVLADVLATGCAEGREPGDPATLQAYLDWRRDDHERVIALTDSLVRLFTNPLGVVRAARALGLIGLDLIGPVKNRFARQSMGLHGRLPRLARGLPLA
jgi:2-octaprenyl-6-methoxyphenol hydroxylase